MKKLRPTVKRDLSLFSVQSWQKGYTKYLKDKLNFWYDIILFYDGEKVNFYHKMEDFVFFKEVVTEKLIKNKKLFKKLNTAFQKDVQSLKKILENLKKEDVKKVSNLIGRIMAFYIFVVSDDFVNRQPDAWQSRYMSEGVLYLVEDQVETLMKKVLAGRGQKKSASHFLSVNEAITLSGVENKNIDFSEVAARKNGYVIFNGVKRTSLSFDDFCSQNGFDNPNKVIGIQTSESVKGNTACGGKFTGKVRIIIRKVDLKKVKKGDVLVSIMTNASYMPYIKKVGAIITDEGGITCHAAIVARENKIPCVVGTKLATKVFKDGDLVEVDASSGVARVIKRYGTNKRT